jgi:hypothetical protein
MAVKAEVLLGLCAAISEALGTASQPLVQMGEYGMPGGWWISHSTS